MITGHGGDIRKAAETAGIEPEKILDMSANTNPLGPMPGMMEHLGASMNTVTRLPDPDGHTAAEAFSVLNGLDPGRVLAAGGTTQLIYTLPRLFPSGRAMIFGPTYSDYADACEANGLGVLFAYPKNDGDFGHDPDRAADMVKDCDLVFICNPNNPTGDFYAPETIVWFAKTLPRTLFVIDESYLPFMPGYASMTMAKTRLSNVVVLRSFSKIYAVPGLRVGFGVFPGPLKERIAAFQMPWCVGSLAMEAVLFAARNRQAALSHIEKTAAYVARERESMEKRLKKASGIEVYPAKTPFMLLKLPFGIQSRDVWEGMLARGVLVRDCANFRGLGPGYVRVSLKDARANARAADLLTFLVENTDSGRGM